MDSIADRVCIFLQRYLTWIESGLERLPEGDGELSGDALEALVAFHTQRDRESTQLLEEYGLLLAEWQSDTGVSAEDRERVQMLWGQVNEKRQALELAFEQSIALVEAARAACGEELKSIRKGRNTLRDYAPPTPDSDFFDRSV